MNASERNLLDESDRMSESMLVRLEDWQLAYLRAAMLHEVEETLNATLFGEDHVASNVDIVTDSPARKGGVSPRDVDAIKRTTKPHASAWGCGVKRETTRIDEPAKLVEIAR